jgi:hypothetical protein
MSMDAFITSTENSVRGQVVMVVYEGSRAVQIIPLPEGELEDGETNYPNRFMRGTIYQVNAGNVAIRDTLLFNRGNAIGEDNQPLPPTGQGGWTALNPGDTTATVTAGTDVPVIIDRNQLIDVSRLQVGQQILICYINDFRAGGEATANPNINDAYLILVER